MCAQAVNLSIVMATITRKRNRPIKKIRVEAAEQFEYAAAVNGFPAINIPSSESNIKLGKLISVRWRGVVKSFNNGYYSILYDDYDTEEMQEKDLNDRLLVGDPKASKRKIGLRVCKDFTYKIVKEDELTYTALSTSTKSSDILRVRKADMRGECYYDSADIIK
jgi:hypothetical protein